MRMYRGTFGPNGPDVTVQVQGQAERPLDIRHDVKHHAPVFEWGHRDPSANQLALALLLDVTGDEPRTLAAYRAFKNLVVSHLDETWELSEDAIRVMLNDIENASDAFTVEGAKSL
jgi:hypothetical protein